MKLCCGDNVVHLYFDFRIFCDGHLFPLDCKSRPLLPYHESDGGFHYHDDDDEAMVIMMVAAMMVIA